MYLLRSIFVHGRKDFFREGYRIMYPECGRHGMSPWQHYVLDGSRKGFDLGNNPPDTLFFPEGYLAEYPDIREAGCDPWRHYAEKGRKEGRDSGLNPGEDTFYAAGYLAMYQDAANSGMDPWHHYVQIGMKEGRDSGNNPPDTLFFREGYEAEYPDVRAAGDDPWHHYAEKGQKEGRDSGLHPGEDRFYAAGYLAMYPDAAKSGMDAWHHYVLIGIKEGRGNGNNPPPEVFFREGYELEYPEVKAAGADPWHHFAEKGRWEGCDNGLNPKKELFSAECYLELYPDAAMCGMDAWHHYVLIGKKAGRDSGNHSAGDGSLHVSWPDAAHFYSKNILIIAELSIPQCRLYRVDQKVVALEKQGYNVMVSRWTDRTGSISLMQDCSVVIFYRVPWREDVIACFMEARRLGIHTVFDIDDLVFDTDVYGQVLKDTQKSDAEKADLVDGVRLYCDAMLQADENWFSTKTLCELSDQDYGTHSTCIPNCIPEEMQHVAEEFAGESRDGCNITIFYGAGSSTHDRDIAEIADVLEQILMTNDNVSLLLIGDIKFGFRNAVLKEKITRVSRLGLTDYYYLISQCDIAVIPLEQSLFNTAKSNIKYIEASLFGIPSVCSDLREFSSVIQNGINGFVAKSKEEWAKFLQLLIESREQREAVGEAAHRTVTRLYSTDALGARLASLVRPYSVSRQRKDAMLIVSVRYGLSSKDASSAAAEGLAEATRAEGSMDVHVFSSYTDPHDPFGTLRRYSWHGVNVWAVNIATVNWCYSDDGIRNIFSRVLSLVSPKLVHFLSIQTLGMDMCLECIERKIPYFVTMHDGWWICARKSLTDTRGRWCGDGVPSGEMCRAKCGISNSDFFRRRHLAQYILRSAAKVYTPTDYFSDFVRRCFPTAKIKTIRSGIPDTGSKPAKAKSIAANDSSRIVLGLFGGRNEYSGYFFLKECLESLGSEMESFRLVLALSSGETIDESRIISDAWPLETEIAEYDEAGGMPHALGKIDVLLYPSMRKECFGLTVREAIKSGVFVVCSDCGGPAEAIADNENGLVFPMGDKAGFTECLRTLIKRKDFIKGYTTRNSGDIRTFREQVAEILGDFAALCASPAQR